MLYFITSNKNKIREAQEILDIRIKQLKAQLYEIQSVDIEKVVRHKIKEAKKAHNVNFIVEDTALYLGGEKEIGALVKFLPNERIVKAYLGEEALAVCCIGISNGKIITGELRGKIVSPKGKNGFGWDPIFLPSGENKTLAEMSNEEKNQISHRRISVY